MLFGLLSQQTRSRQAFFNTLSRLFDGLSILTEACASFVHLHCQHSTDVDVPDNNCNSLAKTLASLVHCQHSTDVDVPDNNYNSLAETLLGFCTCVASTLPSKGVLQHSGGDLAQPCALALPTLD
eukprot:1150229-Pelagomonas_calceolata.AAC.3